MPTEPRRSAMLVFAVFADQQTRIAEIIINSSQRIREDEFVEVRKTVERHRELASTEQQPAIDECLGVMREHWAQRADQRPTVLHAAEGR
jgi:hypothetical protein